MLLTAQSGTNLGAEPQGILQVVAGISGVFLQKGQQSVLGLELQYR